MAKIPYIFRQLTGLKVEEFQKIVEKVRQEWERIEKQKKCHGRIGTLEDKILCVLIYYRTYITHPFLGYLFNLHNSKPRWRASDSPKSRALSASARRGSQSSRYRDLKMLRNERNPIQERKSLTQ